MRCDGRSKPGSNSNRLCRLQRSRNENPRDSSYNDVKRRRQSPLCDMYRRPEACDANYLGHEENHLEAAHLGARAPIHAERSRSGSIKARIIEPDLDALPTISGSPHWCVETRSGRCRQKTNSVQVTSRWPSDRVDGGGISAAEIQALIGTARFFSVKTACLSRTLRPRIARLMASSGR